MAQGVNLELGSASRLFCLMGMSESRICSQTSFPI